MTITIIITTLIVILIVIIIVDAIVQITINICGLYYYNLDHWPVSFLHNINTTKGMLPIPVR